MSALETLRECFELGSMPRHAVVGWRDDMHWVAVGHFRFHYDRHSTGEGIYIRIVHPDQIYLEIVAKSYCPGYHTPDWDHWTCGPWDKALAEALTQIDEANLRLRDERDARRASKAAKDAEEHKTLHDKFASLFTKPEATEAT